MQTGCVRVASWARRAVAALSALTSLPLLAAPCALGCASGPRGGEALEGRSGAERAAAPGSVPPAAEPARARVSAAGSLVALGDTQRTLLFERWIGREQNDGARRALIEALAHDPQLALLIHLGDMVNWGASKGEWQYFDELFAPLTALGVPIYPVLGNHDYWGPDSLALDLARRRFPDLAPLTYRTLRHAGLGLVLADSNLRGPAADEQARWFEAAVERFERDPAVSAVLVFTHHPPFTNGVGREDDGWVAAELLPAFSRAHKTRLWLSGHVHGYERFEVRGKTYVVSGGGGGPRVEYRVGVAASHSAAYAPADAAARAFHYVVISEQAARLLVEVKCIALEGPCYDGLLETFSVPIAAR